MSEGGLLPPLILELRAKASEVHSEIGKVGAEVKALDKETEGGLSGGQKAFKNLAGAGKAAAFGIAGAAVAVGVEGVHMAMEMQESDAKIQGSAQLTAKAATGIGDAFLHTAGTSTFSGKEMADAFGPVAGVVQQLAGHTLNAKDAMTLMKSATDLAEASGQPLNTTTAALTQTMQAFGIKLGDADEASNELFNTSRTTGVGLDQLSSVVSRLHGRLGIAAPDLASTSSLMVDLAQHGISGSRGVMVVQSALQTLLGGTKATNTQLKSLGVHVFDSSGKFVGMQQVLAQLTPKLAKMNDQQRTAAESVLFGKSAAVAMNSTLLGGVGAYQKATDAVETHDAVQKAAEASSGTLTGQVKKLRAGFDDYVTLLGERLIPIVTSVIGFMTRHKTTALILAGVIGGAMVLAVGAWVASLVVSAATAVATAATTVASAAASAAAWVAANLAMIAATGGILLAVAALVAGAIFLAKHWGQVWGDIKHWVQDGFNFIHKYWYLIMAIPLVGWILALATHWHDVWDGIKTVLSDAWAFAQTIFGYWKTVAIDPLVDAINFFEQAWSDVWNAVQTAIQDAWDFIQPIIDTIKSAISDVSSAVHTVTGIAGNVAHYANPTNWFADGGWTPGSVGQPSAAVVHGGEYVLSYPMLTGKAPIDNRVVNAVIMGTAGRRALTPAGPGGGSGLAAGVGAPVAAASNGGDTYNVTHVTVQGSVVDSNGLFRAMQTAALQHGSVNSGTWKSFQR